MLHWNERRVACVRLSLGVLSVAVVGGCMTAETPKLPSELPAEVPALVAARDALTVAAGDALRTTPGGTVVDAVESPAGCWASSERLTAAELGSADAGADALFDSYEYFRFSADGKVRSVSYLEATDGTYATYIWQEGTFELRDGNRLLLTIQDGELYDPATGNVIRFPEDYLAAVQSLTDLTEQERAELLASIQDPAPIAYLVTRQGDQLKLTPTSTNDAGTETVDESAARVVVRFACP